MAPPSALGAPIQACRSLAADFSDCFDPMVHLRGAGVERAVWEYLTGDPFRPAP